MRTVEQRQLRTGDRLEAERLRLLGERHRAVDAVVVGEGERLVSQVRGRERQLLGERGAVEKRVCRMTVEFDVHSERRGGVGSGECGVGLNGANRRDGEYRGVPLTTPNSPFPTRLWSSNPPLSRHQV